MSTLADTVILESTVNPDDVRRCLVEAVNYGWQVDGADGRCNVPANFVGWLLQENERLTGVLESLTKDPPPTLSREPDTDCEVVLKMRAIARAALSQQNHTGGK